MWSWKHRTDNLTNWAGAVRGVASLRNWYLGWDVKDGGWIKVRGEQRVVCACTFWVQEDYNHRPSARRNTGQLGSTQKTARGAKAKAKQRARETGMRGGQRISEHHRHGPSRPTSRHLVVLGGATWRRERAARDPLLCTLIARTPAHRNAPLRGPERKNNLTTWRDSFLSLRGPEEPECCYTRITSPSWKRDM